MRSGIGWILAIILGLILLLLVPGFFMLFPGMMGGFGGMMGNYGMMGRGFGFAPFGVLLVWLVPLGALVLLILGAVGLIRSAASSGRSDSPQAAAAPARACPNCGKPVQSDWNTCPYCGTGLK